MKNISLFLAVAVVMVGCSKDNITDLPQNNNEGVATVLTANIPTTRTYLDSDGLTVKWSASDKIGVFAGSTTNAEFTASEIDGSAAKFSGMATEGATAYYAYFPYAASGALISGTTLMIANAVKAEQTMTEGSFAPDAMTTVGYSETHDLSFKNLCGLAKVTLTGSATITKITIASADGATVLAGTGTVTMNYGENGTPALSMTTGGATSVSLTSEQGITLDATGKTFYIVLPPCTMKGVTLAVEDNAGGCYIKTSANSCIINRAKVLNLGTHAYAPVTPSTADAKYYGKANCIVVTSGTASTTFDVTPYYTKSTTYAYENLTSPTLTKATSASLLWCETALTVGNVSYNSAAQTVTVSGISGVGNAVVALYDADGTTILWSFHIWVTDQLSEINYTNAANKTFYVLDRAIGATSTVAGDAQTAGLYYQWGRKDPLGRTAVLSGTTMVATTGTGFATVLVSDTKSGIAYATQNPTTFITAFDDSPYDWYSILEAELNNNLWGNPVGYDYASLAFVKPKKSVYDPCPAGYKVAPRDTWTAFSTDNFAWNNTYKGSPYNGNFYPASGRRDRLSGAQSYVGSYGLYWSSAPFSSGATTAGLLLFNSGRVLPLSNYSRAFGLPVRCVRE